MVDSASEGQETTVRYLMENTRISDDLFLYGNQVKSIAEFRGSNLEIRQWCKTQVEARKMVTARLGRIEDKFFRLIPKALAFKPIDDIKDFVYSYVLDEKEVNIESLRENVRTYQDMERTLDNVKKRMTKLARIEDFYHQVQNLQEKDQMYEYFLKHADLDLADERITRTRAAVKAEEYRLSQAKEQMDGYLQEREEKRELSTNLRVELKHNEEFVALEEEKENAGISSGRAEEKNAGGRKAEKQCSFGYERLRETFSYLRRGSMYPKIQAAASEDGFRCEYSGAESPYR